MNAHFTIRNESMPSEMGILLDALPRESWEDHPGFQEKTKNWLGAHRMFRRVTERVRRNSEQLLDGGIDDSECASELSYYGGGLISNLHRHHGWEDGSYFPE